MRWSRLLLTAASSLWINPLRTALTLLGMVIGVAAVVTLVSLGSATTSSVQARIQGLGTNLLIVTPGQRSQNGLSQGLGSAQSLTMADVAKLQTSKYISAVAPDAVTRAQIVYADNNYQTQVEGSTPDLFTVRNLQVASGRAFNLVEEQNRANVAVIGSAVAENLFGTADPVGQTILINGLPFDVIGELQTQGASGATNNDDRIIIPLSTLQTRLTGSTTLGTIFVSAQSTDVMAAAQQDIESLLRESHGLSFGQSDDFVITNQANLVSALNGVTQTLQGFLGGIAGISLVVGGIGIMNIMLVSVTERTKEIGLRKAVGATRGAIVQQFLFESGFVGLAGGLVGIAVGAGGAMVVARVMGISVTIDPFAVWTAFIVSFALGVVFGIYPAIRAARLSPIDALRFE